MQLVISDKNRINWWKHVMGELTGKRKPQPKRLVLSPKLLQSTLHGLFASLIGAKLATSLFLRQAQTRSSNTLHLMPSSFTILYPI